MIKKNKILVLGLMLIVLVGLFSPIVRVNAANGTCMTASQVPAIGTPIDPLANPVIYRPYTQAECEARSGEGLKWVPICVPPQVLKSNVCVTPTPVGGGTPADPFIGPIDPTYHLLAPLPCDTPGTNGCDTSGQLTTYDPTGTGGGALGTYLNLMIKLFIGICAVLAVIMIVMGGIQYMTSELPGNKEAGKERIMHAIFGLLLALGAWTLLNTINPDLLKTDLTSLANVTVEVNADVPQPVLPAGQKYADGSVAGTAWAGTTPSLPSGVGTNKGECTTVGQQNCTSLKGLNPTIINLIKSDCPTCQLTITGGTESWLHGANSSHRQGSSTIDISATSDINKYITESGFPNDGSIWTAGDGVCYLAEMTGETAKTTGPHWHVYKC